jgi:hypothetical protein
MITNMDLKKNWIIYISVFIASLIIAANFPITNDESYYIAFAKHLQLSYVDAPPFVSYLNMIQVKLGLLSPLYARSFVMLLHLISTLFLLAIVKNHCANDEDLATKLMVTFLIAYIVPIFGLFGVFILPDCGLILALSILLWVADNVIRTNNLTWMNSFILGLGLGIGLLSKYHILPLGGGIVIGIILELWLRSKFSWTHLAKLFVSVFIGLVCALPLFIWNFEHHFASFVFQLQHGFSSDRWRLATMFAFILGSVFYLTPSFTFVLLKRGLFVKKYWYLLLPIGSLLTILLASSLRKSVLPHWISPAFWLLIPYAVIYCAPKSGQLKSLMKLCKYTALIWVMLIVILLIPGGLMNIKQLSTLIYPDTKVFKDLLLWEELSDLMRKNPMLARTMDITMHRTQNPKCATKKPIIGTFRWFWASQLEYHAIFPGAQILNLDQNSSNFYLWRDNWSDYANCNILLIGGENKAISTVLSNIMTINDEYVVYGLGDYRSLNLQVISARFKDSGVLQQVQHTLASHPHY